MWLAEPFPTPSPINVTVPPDAALDSYTQALANYTRDLVIVTALLVAFTVALAIIGGIALWLQRREIEHTSEQLKLAKEQLKLADKQANTAVEQSQLAREQSEAAKGQLQLAREQFELTSKVAAQQLKQAEATAAMAQEMQRERELAARPYLTVEVLNPPHLDDLMIHNVGRGPALNCVWTYVGDPATSWRRSKVFQVASGTGRRLRASDLTLSQQGEPIRSPIWDHGQKDEQGAHHVADVHALFCQDETGTRLYRFIEGRIGYDVWEGEPSQPPWATFILQLHPEFRPGGPAPAPPGPPTA